MPRLVFALLVAASATACRDLSPTSTPNAASSEETAAELLATCATLNGEYAPFADERGLDDFSTKRQLKLFRRLTKENVRLRSDAAMRLLAHSECRSEGVLYASMRVATLEGDYRTLIDLQEIVSQRGILEACPDPELDSEGWDDDDWDEDDCDDGDGDHGNGHGHGHENGHHKPHHGGDDRDDDDDDDRDDGDDDGDHDEDRDEHVVAGDVLYAADLRVAAASAIGRILEADHPQPPGEAGHRHGHGHGNHGNGHWHDNGHGHGHWDQGHHGHSDDEDVPPLELGVTAEMASQSVLALQIASCPGNPREVRSAAIEALGLARDVAARDFLELIFDEAVEPDDAGANLFLRNMSGRSLTSITGNNHLADSDVDETLGLFLDAWNEQGGEP